MPGAGERVLRHEMPPSVRISEVTSFGNYRYLSRATMINHLSATGFPARSMTGPGRRFCCQVVQVTPLTENDVGGASLVVQVPWKPSEVEPPAAIVAL
jgi:hypothetical protein